jgi:hypothetical protein
MFLGGAELNYFEYHHMDLLNTHKLFIDNLNNYPKLLKTSSNSLSSSFTNYKLSLAGDMADVRERKESENTNRQSHMNNSRHLKQANTGTNNKLLEESMLIYNNRNSDIFIKSIFCDENMLRLIEKNEYFLRLSRIMENILGKLRIDSIVRPLRIFWVKADYKMVGNLLAIVGTGFGLVMSMFFKGFDFANILSNE